jgi:hypothetical protein
MHHILSVAVAISLLPAVHSAAFTFSCSYHNLLRKDADTKCTERPSPRWRGRCAARLGADTPVPCPELIGTAATAFMAFDLPQVRTSSWSILLYDWERIFAEKFLDPNYYTGPVTHMASPLTSH